MSVGDITSAAIGSGARFNDGKPDLSLIPLRMLAYSLADMYPLHDYRLSNAMTCLGTFQETRDPAALYQAFQDLDDYWNDCANVFTFGKKKYAAWNWAKGMAWSIPLACAARHLKAVIEGEHHDPESKYSHIGHVFCNIVMLLHYIDNYPEGDDLPPVIYFAGQNKEKK